MNGVNLLIWGDTETSPALRHEVPLSIGDPFLYLESGGRRAVVTNALEETRIARAAPDLERLLIDALGRDELLAAGWPRHDIEFEVCVRGAEQMGITDAVVPPEFPVALADRMRARGIDLTPDDAPFTERRRRKSAAELAGIRRAVTAGLAGLGEGAGMLRAAEIRDGWLWLDGEQLTSETVRARIREVCGRAGAPAPADIIVKPEGPDAIIGHDPGSGPLPAHTPVVIDLWPRDEASDCWADLTRTFVRGEISDAIAALYELVLTAHERVVRGGQARHPGSGGLRHRVRRVRGGGPSDRTHQTTGRDPPRGLLPRAGPRGRAPGARGARVGTDRHRAAHRRRRDRDRAGHGGAVARRLRVEDLLVVTENGFESLTGSFPYDLAP